MSLWPTVPVALRLKFFHFSFPSSRLHVKGWYIENSSKTLAVSSDDDGTPIIVLAQYKAGRTSAHQEEFGPLYLCKWRSLRGSHNTYQMKFRVSIWMCLWMRFWRSGFTALNEPGVQYECDACSCDLTHSVRIKCADAVCTTGEGVDLCPACFCAGKEFGKHLRSHSYRVIVRQFPSNLPLLIELS